MQHIQVRKLDKQYLLGGQPRGYTATNYETIKWTVKNELSNAPFKRAILILNIL